MDMPIINLENLDHTATEFATKLIGRGGKLRSTKPKDGEAAYVWRMVAFMISPKREHQCMPVMADFGVMDVAPKVTKFCKYMNKEITQTDFDWVRNRCKELDVIVDQIVDNIPKHQWHGVTRWGKALGAF